MQNDTSGTFYVGYTADLKDRVAQHNIKKRRRWSGRQRGEWQLVYRKHFDKKTDALRYERAIKNKKSRIYIERLIKEQSPFGVVD